MLCVKLIITIITENVPIVVNINSTSWTLVPLDNISDVSFGLLIGSIQEIDEAGSITPLLFHNLLTHNRYCEVD